ncbi:MAG: dTMP kinase [Candidatus Pacearchaeota archaeon]|nr:dTMP kinase [Candidatus Pacearchaeota archaeon]
MAKPIFIVFDGIDGNGKSTQAQLLKEYLERKGYEVFLTSEPSKGDYGKKIENILRRREAAQLSKEKWLELFTLDRKENVHEIIGALKEGKMVICDRYYYSTLAYQLQEQEWQSYALKFLKPNIAFILDVPAETAIERLKEKYKITGEKKAFFEKLKILKEVRKKFLLLPNYLNDNIKIIDGSRTIKTVFEDIKKETELLLK